MLCEQRDGFAAMLCELLMTIELGVLLKLEHDAPAEVRGESSRESLRPKAPSPGSLREAVRVFGALFTAYSLHSLVFGDLHEVLLQGLRSEVEWSAEERSTAKRAFIGYSKRGYQEYGEGVRAKYVADFWRMLQRHRFLGLRSSDRARLKALKQVPGGDSQMVLRFASFRCKNAVFFFVWRSTVLSFGLALLSL